ncbi:hypothetical protein [Ornithinimicrobium cryptoxanthini]|uniref:hypothetical protein n=1 Tax=Ornithinimicrobium cryptoxanthini TaxID=2934161 RepID=UPI002119B558|nr:hypothetical protein [Ornithinimicrobium cryptoxanthini]
MRPLRDGLLCAAGAGATTLVWRQLREGRTEGWARRWLRTNHAGREVTLLEGVALVVGSAGTAVVSGVGSRSGWVTGPGPYAVASVGAGLLGAVDDLREDTDRKGLGGHLRALAQGRVTTGAIKILGLAATGLITVAWDDARSSRRTSWDAQPATPGPALKGDRGARHTPAVCLWGTLAGGAVVAGSANLANLFDLRPGRALKVGVLTAVPLVVTGAGSAAGAVTLGVALALLPDDLSGVSMLGDTGANPLGATLGLALVQRQGPLARTLTLAVVTALTLASERVSFTAVIESTPVLRDLDQLGRKPHPSLAT